MRNKDLFGEDRSLETCLDVLGLVSNRAVSLVHPASFEIGGV